MTDDMDRLIEAVEDGDWGNPKDAFPDHKTHMLGFKAYHGSLDAAKSLHEALLPGWWYSLDCVMASVTNGPDDDDGPWFNAAIDGNPARAWLLAILKAYRSQISKA